MDYQPVPLVVFNLGWKIGEEVIVEVDQVPTTDYSSHAPCDLRVIFPWVSIIEPVSFDFYAKVVAVVIGVFDLP